jgi:hypothetical protein
MSKLSTLLVVLAILCLAAAPAFAAGPVLRGIDAWKTVPEATYANLVNNPLPAGFLCNEFPGFTGYIYLKGVPLMSDQGLLPRTDTIVERLDDAVFNKRGVALTRARVRALQLTGVETFRTVCGEFKVDVTLDGEQPLSTMRIVRTNNKGGRYSVPLAVNTKIIFTRVDNEAEQFEFADHVVFEPNPLNAWSYRKFSQVGKRIATSIMVDTDWDGTPDTRLPAQSNFVPGLFNGKSETTVFEASHTVEQ